MAYSISIIFWVIVLAGCSSQNKSAINYLSGSESGIVGGEQVKVIDPLTSSTVLVYDNDGKSICTGSLIAKDWVVTAAHCLGNGSKSFAVLFVTDEGEKVPFKAWKTSMKAFQHPGYTKAPYVTNDIALIQFKGVKLDNYTIVDLPDKVENKKEGYDFTAVGFGANTGIENPVDSGSGILRKVSLKTNFFDRTRMKFSVEQNDGHGICFGDSGGPALINLNGKKTILGVVSYVQFDETVVDRCSQRSFYTNLVPYLDWIRNSIKLGAPAPSEEQNIKPEPAEPPVPQPQFNIGQKAQVDYNLNLGIKYIVTIVGFQKNEKGEFLYQLRFEDGNTDSGYPESMLHSLM